MLPFHDWVLLVNGFHAKRFGVLLKDINESPRAHVFFRFVAFSAEELRILPE